jgi:hypothetical protein
MSTVRIINSQVRKEKMLQINKTNARGLEYWRGYTNNNRTHTQNSENTWWLCVLEDLHQSSFVSCICSTERIDTKPQRRFITRGLSLCLWLHPLACSQFRGDMDSLASENQQLKPYNLIVNLRPFFNVKLLSLIRLTTLMILMIYKPDFTWVSNRR